MSRIIKDERRYKPAPRPRGRTAFFDPTRPTTLITLPPELQAEILSHLNKRTDLRRATHVCHSLRTVALRFLRQLELFSFRDLATFFLPPAKLPSGSAAALNIAEWKRAHWECLREIEIGELWSDWRVTHTLEPLPSSIGGRPAAPIRLDRLRIRTADLFDCISPFLRSLRPDLVELPFGATRKRVARLPAEMGWTDVTALVMAGSVWDDTVPTAEVMASTIRFDHVKSVTLTYDPVHYHPPPDNLCYINIRADLLLLLRLCPAMEPPFKISLPLGDHEWTDSLVPDITEITRDGLEGRPASFFEIRERDEDALFAT